MIGRRLHAGITACRVNGEFLKSRLSLTWEARI